MCILFVNVSKSMAFQAKKTHKEHSILKFFWVSYVCTDLSQKTLQPATHIKSAAMLPGS